jgi:hypothetical protein
MTEWLLFTFFYLAVPVSMVIWLLRISPKLAKQVRSTSTKPPLPVPNKTGALITLDPSSEFENYVQAAAASRLAFVSEKEDHDQGLLETMKAALDEHSAKTYKSVGKALERERSTGERQRLPKAEQIPMTESSNVSRS